MGKSFLVQSVPEPAIYAGYLIRTRYSKELCQKVAELLGRNEAELATAAVPAEAGGTSKEHEAFDMNDFL